MRWTEAQLADYLAKTGVAGRPNSVDTSAPPFALPSEKKVRIKDSAAADRQRASDAASRAFGKVISAENAMSLVDMSPRDLDLAWIVRVSIPFSYAASKNSIYAHNINTRVALKAAAVRYRDTLAFAVKSAMEERNLKQNKLWLSIFVEKPNHKGDAVNVVDLVCDAIKLAIPLDDRWYSIRRLDWSINTSSDPQLFLELAQERGAVDSKCCSLCGGITPLTELTKDRSAHKGHGNICKSCRVTIRPLASGNGVAG
jgi:hypothetical protein